MQPAFDYRTHTCSLRYSFSYIVTRGRLSNDKQTVDQAVSGRLSMGAGLVTARVKLCGICGGESGTEAVLRFPLSLIYSSDCSTIIIIYHSELVQQANKWSQEQWSRFHSSPINK
jgi:hypothetical protein